MEAFSMRPDACFRRRERPPPRRLDGRRARRRKLFFDIAEKTLKQEWLPDTISSDLHERSVSGPAFDLATTLSKFLLLEFPGWTNASRIVTAGDGIFHGSGGVGDFCAFDARTGQQLFKYSGRFGAPDSPRVGIAATPMTYRVNGK